MAVACQMITFLPAFKFICKEYKMYYVHVTVSPVVCQGLRAVNLMIEISCRDFITSAILQEGSWFSQEVILGWTEILNKKKVPKMVNKIKFYSQWTIPFPSTQHSICTCSMQSVTIHFFVSVLCYSTFVQEEEKEAEPLLIYTAQRSCFRYEKLPVISRNPEHNNVQNRPGVKFSRQDVTKEFQWVNFHCSNQFIVIFLLICQVM